MRLSHYVRDFCGTLLSDGGFSRLDYCTVTENGPFLTFMENPKFLDRLIGNPQVSCVLCRPELVAKLPDTVAGVFVTEQPKAYFETLHNILADDPAYKLEDFQREIGEGCDISPMAFIADKNVRIGKNVTIEPFVYIGEHTHIGDDCIIHAGAVIGGRSFSCARAGEDEVVHLRDCGKVVIDDGVTICSNSHIARGILPTDVTRLGKRAVLDAFVHIGHGSKIGGRAFLAAGAIVSGNAVIGENTWIGVNATVSNRIRIGANARVSLGAVVTKDVGEGKTVSGNFAIGHDRFLQHLKDIR